MRILDMLRKWLKKSPTEKPQSPTPKTTERVVWAVRGGRVYHLYPECPSCKRSKKTAIRTTISRARAMGLRECGMCRDMIDRARRV